MLGNRFTYNTISYFFYAVSLIGFSALWYSPAIVSIATVLFILLSLLSVKSSFKEPFSYVGLPLLGILLLVLIDLISSGFDSHTSAKFLLILGFIGVFGASFHYGKSDSRIILRYIIVIAIIVAFVNIISVGNYFLHKDHFDALLLQSKHIPVGIHHIHFGVLNGLVIILLLGSFFVVDKFSAINKTLIITLLGIIFISFHILSSRTGLLSFYGASVVMLIVYAVQQRQYNVLLLGLITISLTLGAAYGLSSSFQNKIANSIEDMSSWGEGEEINFKSMGMRIEAARMCIHIIGQNPIGVGAEAQDVTMAAAYNELNSVLLEENRVGPHNQFLEYGVKYGWVGIILVLSLFIGLFLWAWNSSFGMWGIVVFLLIAVSFESLLERQASLYFIGLLVPISYHFFAIKQNNEVNAELK